jgi:hypothetical protein
MNSTRSQGRGPNAGATGGRGADGSLWGARPFQRSIVACFAFLPLGGAAAGGELTPYTLTAADAVAINARRPADWNPYRVSAGDVFAIDKFQLLHVPSFSPDGLGGFVAIEDLEPIATTGNR